MFETEHWIEVLSLDTVNPERITLLHHRNMKSKLEPTFEWLISQNRGKTKIKLTNRQMKELIDLVEKWESSKYEEARYEEAKYS